MLDTFRAFVDIAYAALSRAPLDEWQRVTRGHEEVIDEYTHALGELALYRLGYGYRDLLGALYMRLEISNARAGQFFTPWEVAYFMAQLQFHDIGRVPTFDDPVRVLDPACGSGVMLLAGAATLPPAWVERGLARFVGVDIDPTCAAIARLNLRIHGLRGEIVCGDSLRMGIAATPVSDRTEGVGQDPPALIALPPGGTPAPRKKKIPLLAPDLGVAE